MYAPRAGNRIEFGTRVIRAASGLLMARVAPSGDTYVIRPRQLRPGALRAGFVSQSIVLFLQFASLSRIFICVLRARATPTATPTATLHQDRARQSKRLWVGLRSIDQLDAKPSQHHGTDAQLTGGVFKGSRPLRARAANLRGSTICHRRQIRGPPAQP